MNIDVKLGSLQINMEENYWAKAIVKNDQTAIGD